MLASSPPVPALISTTTFLESSGSLGIEEFLIRLQALVLCYEILLVASLPCPGFQDQIHL